jgi:hypothetical protein
MSNDVPANRFLVVSCKHCPSIDLGNNLVGHDHSYSKFISKTLQMSEELGKGHLSG